MPKPRTSRPRFVPSLSDAALEVRLVLNGARTALVEAVAAPARVHALATSPGGQAAQQLTDAVTRQLRIATRDARQAVNARIAPLYAAGRPTESQLADFRAAAEGVIDATAYRLSSTAALLTNGATQLAPAIQRVLIGPQANSVAGRIDQLTQDARATRSAASLRSAINGELNRTPDRGVALFTAYLRRNNVARLSVDSSGRAVSDPAVPGRPDPRPVRQLGRGLRAGLPDRGGRHLVPERGHRGDPRRAGGLRPAGPARVVADRLPAREQPVAPARVRVEFGRPELSALVGSGTGLLGVIQGLPNSRAAFNAAAASAFSAGYPQLASTLATSLGLPAQPAYTLPTGAIPGLFNGSFASYGDGFNDGFGSGFPGFGRASGASNPNFGVGFNGLIGVLNSRFGLNSPSAG